MSLPSGWLIVDKHVGVSSAKIVGNIKHHLKKHYKKNIKIGHTGTLDPFASGVLPLAIGEATKLCRFLLDSQKEYICTIKWGARTDTGDHTGDIVEKSDYLPSQPQIENALSHFKGHILQKPHIFSAVKIDGKRAYAMARNGEIPDIAPRYITIYDIECIAHDHDITQLRVSCSKGSYMRVLAEDIAHHLGTVAHLSALRRTKVGEFCIKDAIEIDKECETLYKEIKACEYGLGGISAYHINALDYEKICFGQSLDCLNTAQEENIFFLKYLDKIVAIAANKNDKVHPERLLNRF